jgi:glycosyltransferase involved in cell wall biosynthesis
MCAGDQTLSSGLAVYNGELFLQETLDADFEIISDNASTDATPEICQRFAARDLRKWNGHDDPLAPTFSERCVAALEQGAMVVLADGRAGAIDEHVLPSGRLNPLTAARLKERPRLASHDPRVFLVRGSAGRPSCWPHLRCNPERCPATDAIDKRKTKS